MLIIVCITDIAKQKNPVEPKDVVKNWIRLKNTLEYIVLWEGLNNPAFKGVEFEPLLKDAGSNAFTMSPSRLVDITGAIGIITKIGVGGGTYAQKDIAFKFAAWVSVEFELYLAHIPAGIETSYYHAVKNRKNSKQYTQFSGKRIIFPDEVGKIVYFCGGKGWIKH